MKDHRLNGGWRVVVAPVLATLALLVTTWVTPGRAEADWNGTCHEIWTWQVNDYKAWCEGTGPSSYRVWVVCLNGIAYLGEWRWHGDSRGSRAGCGFNGIRERHIEHTA